jgi:hypothetical protein
MIPDSVRGGVLKLKGKDYLPVAFRLVWFREAHPLGRIVTELVQVDVEAGFAICRASVYDTNGNLLATATKHEDRKGFPDYIEKSETGAIGRALGIAGFGTQFMADELIEGDRLADSPVSRAGFQREDPTATFVAAIRTQIVRNGLADASDTAEVNAVAKQLLGGQKPTVPVLKQVLADLIEGGNN